MLAGRSWVWSEVRRVAAGDHETDAADQEIIACTTRSAHIGADRGAAVDERAAVEGRSTSRARAALKRWLAAGAEGKAEGLRRREGRWTMDDGERNNLEQGEDRSDYLITRIVC